MWNGWRGKFYEELQEVKMRGAQRNDNFFEAQDVATFSNEVLLYIAVLSTQHDPSQRFRRQPPTRLSLNRLVAATQSCGRALPTYSYVRAKTYQFLSSTFLLEPLFSLKVGILSSLCDSSRRLLLAFAPRIIHLCAFVEFRPGRCFIRSINRAQTTACQITTQHLRRSNTVYHVLRACE